MTTALREVFARFGVDGDDPELAAAIEEALAHLPTSGSHPLTDSERRILLEHSGMELTASDLSPTPGQQSRWAIATATDLFADSMSIGEAAAALGIDRTRVSHRLRAGQLWSFWLGAHRRIPRWQVTNGRPLPHLADIVAAAGPDADPGQMSGLMATPQDELGGATPTQHLLAGGDIRPVAQLVRALLLW